jgi:MFS family permease
MATPLPSFRRARQADSAYSWAIAAATLVLASLSFGAVTAVPILFAPIASEFGWSHSRVALVHTFTMVCAGVGSIVIGRLLDRRGFFRIALVAGVGTGAGLVLASHARSFWEMTLAFGLLVGGLGQGAFFSPLAAAVTHWFDRHRSLAVAIALSGQSIGGLLVPPLLRVAAESAGWRSALQGYGLICTTAMLATASLYAAAAPVQAPAAVAHRQVTGSHGGTRLTLLLGANICCSNTATFGIAGHMVTYGEAIGLGPVAAGSMMAALFGITLFSRLGVGHWLAQGGIYRMMLGMSLLHMVGCWLVLAASTPSQLLAAVMVVGLGFGGYLPAYGSFIRSVFPAREAGRRLSELYLLGFLGAGAGTLLVGILRDARGGAFDAGFLATALLATTSCAVLLVRHRELNRDRT